MKNDMPEAKPASAFYRDYMKRVIDLLIAVPVLVLAAIPMGIIALAVKLDSPGPALFKQDRLGKDGKVFQMLKFRSMCVGAEKTGSGVYSGKGDSRVTRVGRIIRATSLDELPQLINVLKGDMSMVGPRPERREFVEEYSRIIPEFTERLKVRGGLTGYAQIYGKYSTGPEDKIKYDLIYIYNYSLGLDIRLLFLTVRILFQKENAEGVDEGMRSAVGNPGERSTKE